MAKKPAKTEALTIRLDPKTRFMLEFIARLRGQPLTTVVERAIAAAADAAHVGYFPPDERTWRDYWDISDGVRAIKVASERELRPTYEEERRLAFVSKHAVFFYAIPRTKSGFRHGYIDVLWPRIDEFIEIDEAQLATDYFAAGKAMVEALKSANLKPPVWPPKADEPAPSAAAADDDSDIPF